MFNGPRWLAVLTLTAALAGCQTPSSMVRLVGQEAPLVPRDRESSVDEPAEEVTTADSPIDETDMTRHELASAEDSRNEDVQATVHAVSQSAKVELHDPGDSLRLTLENAIAFSLERNPDLAAVRASEPVAHAAFHVAETYPWNPQFQTQILPYTRDRDGNTGLPVSQQHVIVQTFELGGQQRFRIAAAAANWAQVNGTIRQAELTNIAQTTRLFMTAIYQRDVRDIYQSLAELNEQLVGVIERREKAGQSNHADVELARLQVQSSRHQERLAEANYQTAIMNLRNQLNLDAYAPMELAGHWASWKWRSLDDLIGGSAKATALRNADDGLRGEASDASAPILLDDAILRQLVFERPDVVAARSASAMANSNLQLADAMRRPNLQIGPMYQSDNTATQYWGVQAQIDLPIVDTGMPLVKQRIAEQRQQQITVAQLENRAVLDARGALRRYERARRLLEQSRGDFARGITDSLKSFEDLFKAGQITLLQVFAARAALVQSRQSFLGLLNEVAQAAADVTLMTALPPARLVTVGGEQQNVEEVLSTP